MGENKKSFMRRLASLIVLIIVICVAVYGGYLYSQKSLERDNPSIISDREIRETTTKVGALMEIPKDEQPAMITILDKSQLNNEAFFAEAQNGDRILVYGLAKKVIIYRPSTNKIIEATTFVLPPQ